MSLGSSLGHSLRRCVAAAGIGAETLGSLDANPVPADWRHVTKIDPETAKLLPVAYPLYLANTDAVSVGGSTAVTADNTEETFRLLARAPVPAFHEPSEARHVTEETRELAAFLALPEVLNGETEALVGTLGEGLAYLHDEMVPALLREKLPAALYRAVGDRLVDFATSWLLEAAVFEAYVVQNPDSAAARRSGVDESDVLSPATARERAMVADRHLDSEIVYVEYSGTYGGDEAADVLRAVSESVDGARVWYGGGIDDREKTAEMLAVGADTVVVGDCFHDVADEEVEVCARAVEALGVAPSADEIRSWFDDAVDPVETAAARYLRTTPRVDDPEAAAERSLLVALALCFGALPAVVGESRPSVERTRSLLSAVDADAADRLDAALSAGDPEAADGDPLDDYCARVAAALSDADPPRLRHLSLSTLSVSR
ncbi:PcrB family protein [Halosimplex carlsbadense 2-9-1]|uniref:phosphoglycerol geranylgeranyltransferase n=1 Tax=Halosimplex carlsbadense 2-9-1 TaxID=797114 RepID=M0CWJ9_9EURY|nr:heptaprenylglyceryl phosphate synthase [Halosimplex carlsbadense]ELZ27565.1 PcrB family protein [Halosimplex carlsbadense 2-9-1]